MKNRILFILCVLVATFSLTACEDEKPHVNTEKERETQNTQEQDTGISFLGSDIEFFYVSKLDYENHLSEGHVVALLGSQEEWTQWQRTYLPGRCDDDVFEHYNSELFQNNYLLIYQGDLRQYGHKTTGVERIYIEDNEIRIEEFDFYNELLMIDSKEQNHYIPYHMCWIKKQSVPKVVYDKYKGRSYRCIDGMTAYYIYPNLTNEVEVKYTHDGGVSWDNSKLITDMVYSGDKEVEYYFLSPQVGYVLDIVTSAKNPPVVRLWHTKDGAASWQEISWISEQMMQEYPMGLLFFDEQKGIMLTDGRQSPILSNIGYPVYYTEDGGGTWTGIELSYSSICYENLEVMYVEKISEAEAKLYAEVTEFDDDQLKVTVIVYSTENAGKTWRYQTHNGKVPELEGMME